MGAAPAGPWTIPFNRPSVSDTEREYVAAAFARGHLSGDGPYTQQCHTALQQILGVPRALLTTSCSHALEMSALLLHIAPGDEVIVPSFAFVTTVSAFVMRGATPVFWDIRPDTLNVDEAQLEALITPRTRAIVVLHYAGVGCEMDTILDLAGRHGIPVVEDNAHGLFGRYRGRYLGTFGALATQSFHETKNISCGEGGALLLNDASLIERAEIIREKGTDRSRYFRGQVDKYSWVELGSSYLPSEILAAFLAAQLERWKDLQARRQRVWERYRVGLSGWTAAGAQLQAVPPHCDQAYHMFYMLLPNLDARQAFIAHLRAQGILSVFHYLPLHLSPMGKRLGGDRSSCPVTVDISDRLVRLPFFADLTEADQDRVIEATVAFNIA
jgi:dTDP-4-amino-4,6-dideoxygalactose transaminase